MWATTYSPYINFAPGGLCPGEDTPASTHIKSINAGKLRLSIQRLQKRGQWGGGVYGSAQITVTKVHCPTLLALRGGGWVSNK